MPAVSVVHRFVRGAVLATLICGLLPVAAHAYTLVLRSGRHVNLPDDFRVTPGAVIYEASPGLTVKVWLTNVDVAATEKANAEPSGSFTGRIRQEPSGHARSEGRATPKVITNRDLEPSRLRRQAQASEYERTHRERGLPSTQELQEHFEEQDRRLHALALQLEKERAEAEVESLKSELVAVKRNVYELGLLFSRQTETYIPAYVTPSYFSYYYAPPVQFIPRPSFGHRGGFVGGNFRLHPRVRAWPYNQRRGHPFPSRGGQPVHRSAPRHR